MKLIEEKKVGVLGRIVIPDKLRESHGMRPGDLVGIYTQGDMVILRSLKAMPVCCVCGHAKQVVAHVQGKPVCADCSATIVATYVGKKK